jgi:EAL domain-containing protein (putative c-di-GMP-specific phosphodiesterase class I)/ABC-type amino acid transport substrate-binding protein
LTKEQQATGRAPAATRLGRKAAALLQRRKRLCGSVALCAALSLAAASAAAFHPQRIVFGGDAAYPPFEWRDGTKPTGFDIDLEDAISEHGGAEAEHRLGNWPDAVRALQSGAVDVVAMFGSNARARQFLFTPAFHYVNHGVYARKGFAHVSSFEDLAGHTVAVEGLSYADQRIRAGNVPVHLVLTSNTLTALQAVADKRADYAVLAAPTSDYLIHRYGLALENVGPPLWPRGYVFAVRKDRTDLAAWLTAQLDAVLKNGRYQQIYAQWAGQLAPTPQSDLTRIAETALIPLLALTLLGMGWACLLRRRVATGAGRLHQAEQRRAAAEQHADWVANHDADTGLPRLQSFSARVGAQLASAETGSSTKQIVAMKLAGLDRTIRTLGHEAGAEVMRAFAERLRAMELPACGQSGRDVFLVFGDKARIDAELRRDNVAFDTTITRLDAAPLLFAGTASWPTDGATLNELLRHAETALALAFKRREAWVDYRSSMEPDQDDLRLLELFRKTRGAGLHAVFQPQIDVQSGAVVGAEALARWHARGIGDIPPGKFIPLLEDAGLIRQLTSRMIFEGVRVAAALRRMNMDCPVGVNVTASDLADDRTRTAVFKALRAHSGLARDLKLELTETTVAESTDAIRWSMSKLRDNGIRIAIDDFGTGYSSLAYLSEFPVHEVKLDRSFVTGMAGKPHNRSIVRSTISMAHELGLRVVAEGVEEESDLVALGAEGCDYAQGFLIAKPLPEAQLVHFVKAAHAAREKRRGTPA